MVSLTALRAEAAGCRACPLWRHATQIVFGEGPASARIMFVGEQPGSVEDLAGRPFVGPAGRILDQAVVQAGIDRKRQYVTNAVKHFKFVRRGKKRIHQRPTSDEVTACRWWLANEIAAVQPSLVVALGASAAHAVIGRAVAVNKVRGQVLAAEDSLGAVSTLVTVHPSYLLRIPDPELRRLEYERFVEDLRLAKRMTAARKGAAVGS